MQLSICALLGFGGSIGAASAAGNSSVKKRTEENAKLSREGLIDPPSTLTGAKLKLSKVIRVSYDAGFKTEEQLVTITAIAVAESGLFTASRNWHPEKGFRPAEDVITVKGPPGVWLGNRQMHSDRGLWQIASFWFPQYSDAVTDNPSRAAAAAFEISGGGAEFHMWDSYAAGRAQRHFDREHDGWPAVKPLVRRFLKSGKK